jgi:hypothetical protein
MTPGRKFSTTTSADAASRRASATPAASVRSMTTDRLLRLTAPKYVEPPAESIGGCQCRVSSPDGGSIFTTSAPKSASIIVA